MEMAGLLDQGVIALTVAQADEGASGVSLLQTIAAGGAIGFLIIIVSFVALALVVRHLLQLREQNLAPGEIVDELHELLGRGDVPGAIAYCEDDENDCFLARTIGGGLKRAQKSPFGALELRGALEESGAQEVSKLYRSTDGLNLIAGVAPMLGLLGTVVGMVGAFNTISSADGFARPDQLAGDISKALVTTLMGLVLAIPCMAAFTYFRNRIDALAGDIAEIVDELATHLDEGSSRPQQQARPTPKAAPAAGSSAG